MKLNTAIVIQKCFPAVFLIFFKYPQICATTRLLQTTLHTQKNPQFSATTDAYSADTLFAHTAFTVITFYDDQTRMRANKLYSRICSHRIYVHHGNNNSNSIHKTKNRHLLPLCYFRGGTTKKRCIFPLFVVVCGDRIAKHLVIHYRTLRPIVFLFFLVSVGS